MSVRRLAVLGLVLVASPGTVAAQSTDREVAAEVERLPPRLIEIRPDIQRNPELSNRETRTPPRAKLGRTNRRRRHSAATPTWRRRRLEITG